MSQDQAAAERLEQMFEGSALSVAVTNAEYLCKRGGGNPESLRLLRLALEIRRTREGAP